MMWEVEAEATSDGRGQRPRWIRSLVGPCIVVVAAILATLPLWLHGASCGHDFDFHLVSWLDALHSWRDGVLYPHWTPSPNYGAGEPRFIFYPPLTWMLGAALGAVLPWTMVPAALTFLLLAAAGLATRTLAKDALSDGAATLAGCVAIFSGYALFTAYERTAFGELAGGFWVPLLLLWLLRNAGRDRSGSHRVDRRCIFSRTTLFLILVVAGAWLSNAPLGVMVAYLLVAVGLAKAVLNRSWRPALRALVAGIAGTGVAAFYLVPAAWEQRWVDIRQAVDDPGYMIQNSWLFARHSDPRLQLHDIELARVSAIGVSMIGVALLAMLVGWWRGTLPRNRRWWMPLALIPLAVLILQLPVSLPAWNLLPKLRFLQFPWRWLVVVEAPMSVLFAAAVWSSRRWVRVAVVGLCVALCGLAMAYTSVSFYQGCDEEDAVVPMVTAFKAGDGFEGSDEYAPPSADNSVLATSLPAACLVSDPERVLGTGARNTTPDWSADQGSCRATYDWTAGDSAKGHLSLRATVAGAGFLVLRLREYPAWNVTVNGTGLKDQSERQDGLMVVPVAGGGEDIEIQWTTTPDVVAGRVLSLLSLGVILAACFVGRSWDRSRLS